MSSKSHSPHNTPIAIIGLGCLFPKGGSKQGFWRVLRTGANCIEPVPETHWSVNDLYDGDHASPDRCYAKVGGFLEPYPFDPTEFNIPPNVLEATDTSQLLGLVGAKAALEDAGYGPQGKELPKDRTGVILGVTGALEMVVPLGARLGHPRWRKALAEAGIDRQTCEKIVAQISDSYVSWQENSFPGLLGNVVAGRIANRLDLHGTNCTVDAACASSLAAVHLAINELQAGQADMVLTGGVDTFNDIFMFTCFSKTPALSDSGRIAPFSADADGTLLGEGVGIFVLKRLADAERDQDKIYAVIRGMGSSSDGNSGSIYAPSAPGQAIALRRAYEAAHIDPQTVDMVEAHGTGTKVGDIVEFNSLREVFKERQPSDSCALGTVKSQIGHTKAAAGAASLAKTALALFYKVLPPTLNISAPHPKLNLRETPFYLNIDTRPWLSSQHPRRAGVSSFGFGGSNFHIVLEEYSPKRTQPAWDGSCQIWAFSAPSRPELAAAVRQASQVPPYESAYWAQESRRSFQASAPFRATLVCGPNDSQEKLAELAQALEEESTLPANAFYGEGEIERGQIAFLFPGQGSQYVGMGRDLFSIFPEAFASLEKAHQLLDPSQDPAAFIFPISHFDPQEATSWNQALTATQVAQPSLGTIESSMARVLESFGLKPQALAGHSYGELVALERAGVYSQSELFRLSALRGSLMAAGDGGRGAMSALSAPLAKIEALVAEVGGELVLANRNHPTQGVISGPKEAIDQAEALCKERKITAHRLQVSAAFHSSLMTSARQPFGEALAALELKAPQVPVYANISAQPYPQSPEEIANTLGDQLVSSVRFIEIIENMYQAGFRTFIEVGPKTVLTGLVKKILGQRPHYLISTDGRKGGAELQGIALTLAQLSALGAPLKLSAWEAPVSKPRAKRMVIPISGANYRTPNKKAPAPYCDPKEPVEGYQPLHFVSDNPPVLPAPAPQPLEEVTLETAAANEPLPPLPKVAPPAIPVPPAPAPGPQEGPIPERIPAPAAPAAAPKLPAQLQVPAPVSSHAAPIMAQALQTIQQGLAALQALQAQTAAAHLQFLQSQAQIQSSLQAIIAAQQNLAGAQLGQAPLSRPLTVSAPPLAQAAFPPVAPTPWPQAPAFPSPSLPVGAPLPTQAPAPELTSTPLPPEPVAPSAPKAAPTPAPAPQAPPSPAVAAEATLSPAEIQQKILATVAQMTGYPLEMLNLDMSLEGDLGIDSIKRVEILSALHKELPQVSEIAPEEIGSLQTLRQVAQRLQSKIGAPSAPAPATTAPTAEAPALSAAAPSEAAPVDAAQRLLEVVSQATGYPQETLNLDMDLESDLGIDSIKRVEILAAMQKVFPQAQELAPEELNSLRTLRQIVEKLAPAQKAAASAAPAATTAPSETVASAAPPAAHLDPAEAVLEVVAQTTGYPLETLNLDMDLESDLGIDSIKRVEILATLQKLLPGSAAHLDSESLSNLHTLRDIAQALQASAPSAPVAAPAQAASPSDALALVLEVIAQATGYPLETLSPEMDLESDLGIDSIKRVEILATLQKVLPKAGEIAPEELNSLRTIGDIVRALSGEGGPQPPQPGPAPQGPRSDSTSDSDSTSQAAPQAEEAPVPSPAPAENAAPAESAAPAETAAPTDAVAPVAETDALPFEVEELGGAPADRLLRRVLSYELAPNPLRGRQLDKRGLYLLLDDGFIAPALAPVLTRQGLQVELVDLAQASDPQYLAALPAVSALFLTLPSQAPQREEEIFFQRSAAAENLKERFRLARSLAQTWALQRRQPSLIVTITRLDGQFGTSGQPCDPLAAGLHGLTRVLAQEYPHTVCRSFDLHPQLTATEAAGQLVRELQSEGSNEVGLSPQGRRIPVLREEPLDFTNLHLLPPHSTILVTGGARGVTAQCVKLLAKLCRPNFVLVGRSAVPTPESSLTTGATNARDLKSLIFKQAKEGGRSLSPQQLEKECQRILANREITKTIAEVRSYGSRVNYVSMDVRDDELAQMIVRDAHERFGPIVGLIHGAGVLADRLVVDKTDEQFDRVFDTKVTGLYNFYQALQDEPLQFVYSFSSVSARFGRPGQCDYAMANEVMNKFTYLASHFRPEVRFGALGWGPWDGGMVDRNLRQQFDKLGIELIDYRRGAQSLVAEILAGPQNEHELIFGKGFDVPQESYPSPEETPGAETAPPTSAPTEPELDVHTPYQTPLTLKEYPLLEDHVFNGNSVVPLALMVEIVAQACQRYFPHYHFRGCDNLRILKPVTLPHGETPQELLADSSLSVNIVDIKEQSGLLQVNFYLDHHLPGEKTERCAAGTALLSAEVRHQPADSSRLPHIQERDYPLSTQEAYQRYLFHGPSLQAIRKVKSCSDQGLLAKVAAPKGERAPLACGKQTITHPLFLDGALQSGLFWTGAQRHMCSLPMFGGRYRQYVREFPEEAKILLYPKEISKNQMCGDIFLVDKRGILAEWRDVRWIMTPELAQSFRHNKLGQ